MVTMVLSQIVKLWLPPLEGDHAFQFTPALLASHTFMFTPWALQALAWVIPAVQKQMRPPVRANLGTPTGSQELKILPSSVPVCWELEDECGSYGF